MPGFILPTAFRDRHLGTLAGQPPWRDNARFELATVEKLVKMPKGFKIDELLARPVFTSAGAVQDLGLDTATTQSWAKFLETVMHSSTIEPIVRQQVMQRLRDEQWDPELKKVMFQRAVSLHRNLKKSIVTVDDLANGTESGEVVMVMTPDQLQKAEPRGGEYHRRIPKKGGKGFTYYYNPEKYNDRGDAHQSGEEMTKYAMGRAIERAVDGAGDGGCSVNDLKKLAKKYGGKETAAHLKASCGEGGSMSYANGRFHRRKKED